MISQLLLKTALQVFAKMTMIVRLAASQFLTNFSVDDSGTYDTLDDTDN